MMLVLASGVPFNGMFLYVLATPVFLGEHLQFAPTQFFWFFLCTIGGIMAGAAVSGRLAGKMSPKRQIMRGFRIMVAVSVVNIALNLFVPLNAFWALPLIGLFSFGWALMVPVVTLLVLDQVPERRGMASSLQACIGSAANGLVAGLLVPLVMHSPLALALASAGLMVVGLLAWYGVRRSVAA
jgi:DHA1 family bicyclomycin/chloramphenicol resistance-like MFS transporter